MQAKQDAQARAPGRGDPSDAGRGPGGCIRLGGVGLDFGTRRGRATHRSLSLAGTKRALNKMPTNG